MTRMQKKKMYDTTDYKGRNFEMNVSKNRYLAKAKQNEKRRTTTAKKPRR